MAGLGAKLFTAFSKLTAAQVNGYLMDQSIMRFASTAARDAAFGGVGEPTLAEGMTCYLDDTNVLQSYTGSAWVSVASSSTVADVSSGLVFVKSQTVGSGVTTLTMTDAFNSTYDNYRIVLAGGTMSASASIQLQIGGSTTSYYGVLAYAAVTDAGISLAARNNAAQLDWIGGAQGGQHASASFDLLSPFLARYTRVINGIYQDNNAYGTLQGEHKVATSYSSFSLLIPTGTLTGGTLTSYGYRK